MSRLAGIAACVSLVWLVVITRAGLFLAHQDELREAAVRQRTSSVAIEPRYGQIVDRAGRPLAVTKRLPSLFANPSRIDDYDAFARDTGPLIRRDETELAAWLHQRKDRRFLWLSRQTDEATVDAFRHAELPRGSWGVRHERRRVYPQGTVAAHLIGFRDIDHAAITGIERTLDPRLEGRPGRRQFVRDARGRTLSPLDQLTQSVTPGETIRLTIDAAASTIVDRELALIMAEHEPSWAAAILVDVASGELRAIQNQPTFDPNAPSRAVAAGFDHARRTRVEPGSTVKPFLAAAAIDAGLCETTERIEADEGRRVFGSRVVRDSHPMTEPTVAEILIHSSNLGAAAIAGRLGPGGVNALYEGLRFDRIVQSDLPVPQAGKLRPVAEWSGYSLGSHAIGYEVAITPLHLAAAYTTLARQGVSVPLRFLDGDTIREPGVRHFDRQTCEWLIAGPLRDVVRLGTARRAGVDGADVFGKTGTAQKFDPDTGTYRSDRTVCLFAGGIPSTDPRLVVVVVVDEPSGDHRGGGTVAAPAAVRILRDCDRLLFGDRSIRSE